MPTKLSLHLNNPKDNRIWDAAFPQREISPGADSLILREDGKFPGGCIFFPNLREDNYEPAGVRIYPGESGALTFLHKEVCVEAWIKLIDYPVSGNIYPIYCTGFSWYNSNTFELSVTATKKLSLSYYTGRDVSSAPLTFETITSATDVPLNRWVHVGAVVYKKPGDPSKWQLSLLIDGVKENLGDEVRQGATRHWTNAAQLGDIIVDRGWVHEVTAITTGTPQITRIHSPFNYQAWHIVGLDNNRIDYRDDLRTGIGTHFNGFRGYMQGFHITTAGEHSSIFPYASNATTYTVPNTLTYSPGEDAAKRNVYVERQAISFSRPGNLGSGRRRNNSARRGSIQIPPNVSMPKLVGTDFTIEGWFRLTPCLNRSDSGSTGGVGNRYTNLQHYANNNANEVPWRIYIRNAEYGLTFFVNDGANNLNIFSLNNPVHAPVNNYFAPSFNDWFFLSLSSAYLSDLTRAVALHINGRLWVSREGVIDGNFSEQFNGAAGSGATFNITRDGSGKVSEVAIALAGNNYKVGEVLVIAGANIGGVTPANNLELVVTSVSFSGNIQAVLPDEASVISGAAGQVYVGRATTNNGERTSRMQLCGDGSEDRDYVEVYDYRISTGPLRYGNNAGPYATWNTYTPPSRLTLDEHTRILVSGATNSQGQFVWEGRGGRSGVLQDANQTARFIPAKAAQAKNYQIQTLSVIGISSAGNVEIIGTYLSSTIKNGKLSYLKADGASIEWSGTLWLIKTGPSDYFVRYSSSSDVDSPHLAQNWQLAGTPGTVGPLPDVFFIDSTSDVNTVERSASALNLSFTSFDVDGNPIDTSSQAHETKYLPLGGAIICKTGNNFSRFGSGALLLHEKNPGLVVPGGSPEDAPHNFNPGEKPFTLDFWFRPVRPIKRNLLNNVVQNTDERLFTINGANGTKKLNVLLSHQGDDLQLGQTVNIEYIEAGLNLLGSKKNLGVLSLTDSIEGSPHVVFPDILSGTCKFHAYPYDLTLSSSVAVNWSVLESNLGTAAPQIFSGEGSAVWAEKRKILITVSTGTNKICFFKSTLGVPEVTILASAHGGMAPTNIAIDPAENRAFVTCQDSANILCIDLESFSVVGAIEAPGTRPWDIVIHPDGAKGYFSDFTQNTGRVWKFNPGNLTLGTQIAVRARKTAGLAFNTSGTSLYIVGNQTSCVESISTINDTASTSITSIIPTSAQIPVADVVSVNTDSLQYVRYRPTNDTGTTGTSYAFGVPIQTTAATDISFWFRDPTGQGFLNIFSSDATPSTLSYKLTYSNNSLTVRYFYRNWINGQVQTGWEDVELTGSFAASPTEWNHVRIQLGNVGVGEDYLNGNPLVWGGVGRIVLWLNGQFRWMGSGYPSVYDFFEIHPTTDSYGQRQLSSRLEGFNNVRFNASWDQNTRKYGNLDIANFLIASNQPWLAPFNVTVNRTFAGSLDLPTGQLYTAPVPARTNDPGTGMGGSPPVVWVYPTRIVRADISSKNQFLIANTESAKLTVIEPGAVHFRREDQFTPTVNGKLTGGLGIIRGNAAWCWVFCGYREGTTYGIARRPTEHSQLDQAYWINDTFYTRALNIFCTGNIPLMLPDAEFRPVIKNWHHMAISNKPDEPLEIFIDGILAYRSPISLFSGTVGGGELIFGPDPREPDSDTTSRLAPTLLIDDIRYSASGDVFIAEEGVIVLPASEPLPRLTPFIVPGQVFYVNAWEDLNLVVDVVTEQPITSFNFEVDEPGYVDYAINWDGSKITGRLKTWIPHTGEADMPPPIEMLLWIRWEQDGEEWSSSETITLYIRVPFNLMQGPALGYTHQIVSDQDILSLQPYSDIILINAKGKFYLYDIALNKTTRIKFTAFGKNAYRRQGQRASDEESYSNAPFNQVGHPLNYTWARDEWRVYVSVDTSEFLGPTGGESMQLYSARISDLSAENFLENAFTPVAELEQITGWDLANINPSQPWVYFKGSLGGTPVKTYRFNSSTQPTFVEVTDTGIANGQYVPVRPITGGFNKYALSAKSRPGGSTRFTYDYLPSGGSEVVPSDITDRQDRLLHNKWHFYLHRSEYIHHVTSPANNANVVGYLYHKDSPTTAEIENNVSVVKLLFSTSFVQEQGGIKTPQVPGGTRRYRPLSMVFVPFPLDAQKYKLIVLADTGTPGANITILETGFTPSTGTFSTTELVPVRTLPIYSPSAGLPVGARALSPLVPLEDGSILIFSGEAGPQIIKYFPFGDNTYASLRKHTSIGSLALVPDGTAFPRKVEFAANAGFLSQATDSPTRYAINISTARSDNFVEVQQKIQNTSFDYMDEVIGDRSFFVEGWFRFEDTSSKSNFIEITQNSGTTPNDRIQLSLTSNGAFTIFVNTANTTRYNAVQITANNALTAHTMLWKHIRLQRSRNNHYYIYLDGVLQPNPSATASAHTFPNPMRIRVGASTRGIGAVRVVFNAVTGVPPQNININFEPFGGPLGINYSNLNTNYALTAGTTYVKALEFVGDRSENWITPPSFPVNGFYSPLATGPTVTSLSVTRYLGAPQISFTLPSSNLSESLIVIDGVFATEENLKGEFYFHVNKNAGGAQTIDNQTVVNGLTINKQYNKTYLSYENGDGDVREENSFSLPLVYSTTNCSVEVLPQWLDSGRILPFINFSGNLSSISNRGILGSLENLQPWTWTDFAVKVLFKVYAGESSTPVSTREVTFNIDIKLPFYFSTPPTDQVFRVGQTITPFQVRLDNAGTVVDSDWFAPPGITVTSSVTVLTDSSYIIYQFSGTPTQVEDSSIVIEAYDVEGDYAQWVIAADVAAGFNLDLIADQIFDEMELGIIDISLTIEPDLIDTPQIVLQGFPSGWTYNAATQRITGSANPFGSYDCSVSAQLNSYVQTRNFTLTINGIWKISDPQDRVVLKLVEIRPIEILVVGSVQDNINITVSDLPAGLTFNSESRSIVGTPTETTGYIWENNVIITATRFEATKTVEFRLEVKLELSLAQKNQTYTYVIGQEIPPLELTISGRTPLTSITAQNLLNGLSLDPVAKTISGVALESVSRKNCTIKLFNGADFVSFTIYFTAALDLSIVSIANQTYSVGQDIDAIYIQWTGNSPVEELQVTGLNESGLYHEEDYIVGTPENPGTYSVRVRIYSSGSYFEEISFTISILEDFDIALPAFIFSKAQFVGSASGEVLTVTELQSGAITLDMELSASGINQPLRIMEYITGNDLGTGGTGTYKITPINAASGTKTWTGLSPNVRSGSPIEQVPMPTTGNIVSITWNNLPPGISWNNTAKRLQGTPTQVGKYYSTVTIVDDQNSTKTKPDYSTFSGAGSLSTLLTGPYGGVLTVISLSQNSSAIRIGMEVTTSFSTSTLGTYLITGYLTGSGGTGTYRIVQLATAPTTSEAAPGTLYFRPRPLLHVVENNISFYIEPLPKLIAPGRRVNYFPVVIPPSLVSYWEDPVGLPDGLTQAVDDPGGIITGLSNEEGQGVVSITACTEEGLCVSQTIEWSIAFKKVTLLPTTITIRRNVSINTQLTTSQDIPVGWEYVGNLPAGITFNTSTGTFTGMTNVPNGIYTITVIALGIDSIYNSDSVEITLQIGMGYISLTPYISINGVINADLEFDIAAEGEVPEEWYIAGQGTITPWNPGPFTVNSIGTIIGRPTAVGAYRFGVLAEGQGATSNLCEIVIDVVDSGGDSGTSGAPNIQNAFVTARQNEAFTKILFNVGGTIADWEVVEGEQPLGINLGELPSGDFSVSGILETLGEHIFTVRVWNDDGDDTFVITLVISDGRPVIPQNQTFTFIRSAALLGTDRLVVEGNPPSSIAFESLPSGITFNSANYVFTGTAPATSGETIHELNASNTSGEAPATYVKFIISDIPVNIDEGQFFETFLGSDLSAAVVYTGDVPTSVSAIGLPPGITVAMVDTEIILSGIATVAGLFTAVITVNNFGNTGSSDTVSLGVNVEAPVLTSQTTSGVVGEPFNFQMPHTGGLPTFWGYTQTSVLPSGLRFSTLTGKFTGTPTAPGNYNMEIFAQNNGGTSSAPVAITITRDVVAPSITPGQIFNLVKGAAISPLTLSSTGGTPTAWSATGLPAGLTIAQNTGAISGFLTALTGTVESFVTASNFGGESTVVVVFNIVGAEAPPVFVAGQTFTFQLNQSIAENATISFTGNNVTITATGLPLGVSIAPSTGKLQGRPTVQGTFNPQITLTNSGGTVNGAIGITVTANQAAPALEQNLPTLSLVKDALMSAYTFSNSGGPAANWSAAGLPTGLNFSNGVLSGRPRALSSNTFTVTASNSSGSSSTSLLIEVVSALGLPTIAAQTISGTVNLRLSKQLEASGSISNWSVVGSSVLPSDITLNSSTGLLSGTPTSVGTSTVEVRATNEVGSAQAIITLNVVSNVRVPVIVSGQVFRGRKGVSLSHRISTNAEGNAATGWKLAAGQTLPPGISLDFANGVLTGTPTAVGTTSTTLIAFNSAGDSAPVAVGLEITESTNIPILPQGQIFKAVAGVAYTKNILFNGTVLEWRVVLGELPNGLTLNGSTGVILGTATEYTPDRTVRIFASNADGGVEENILIGVNDQLVTIPSSQIFNGFVGDPLAGQIQVSGTPVNWLLNNPPASLNLIISSTGAIVGAPTQEGQFDVVVTVSAAGGTGTSNTIKINIGSKTPKITANQVITVTTANFISYNIAYSVIGNVRPANWVLLTPLPAGLNLTASTGNIFGVATQPTANTGLEVNIKVESSYGSSTEKIKVFVASADTLLKINPEQLFTASVNAAFEITPTHVGNPTRWYILELPSGITINSITGKISGTFTTPGTKRICVYCENSKFDASAFINVVVS